MEIWGYGANFGRYCWFCVSVHENTLRHGLNYYNAAPTLPPKSDKICNFREISHLTIICLHKIHILNEKVEVYLLLMPCA